MGEGSRFFFFLLALLCLQRDVGLAGTGVLSSAVATSRHEKKCSNDGEIFEDMLQLLLRGLLRILQVDMKRESNDDRPDGQQKRKETAADTKKNKEREGDKNSPRRLNEVRVFVWSERHPNDVQHAGKVALRKQRGREGRLRYFLETRRDVHRQNAEQPDVAEEIANHLGGKVTPYAAPSVF